MWLILPLGKQNAWSCTACIGPGSDIYVRMHVEIRESSVHRLDMTWELAEDLSTSLAREYDQNGDNRLNAAEQSEVADFFRQHGQPADFAQVVLNDQSIAEPEFQDLTFEWSEDQSRIRFVLPLQAPIDDRLQLSLRFVDPEGQFRFFYVQDSVSWNSPPGYRLVDNAHLFPRTLKVSIKSRGSGQE
jgi:ABC-type uncharacterized transport system substrate-binding protein